METLEQISPPQKLHKIFTDLREILRPKTKIPFFLPENTPPLCISSIHLEFPYPHLTYSFMFLCILWNSPFKDCRQITFHA